MILFFFYGWVVFHGYVYHIFLLHLSVHGHLGCFYVLTIANCAAMTIRESVSFSVRVLKKQEDNLQNGNGRK